MVGGANRAVLRDSARLEAFQQSRRCFERILAALPGRGSSAEVENSRSILVGPLAEVLVEVGALVAADSLAAAELEQAARGQRWFVGNIQYDMNQVRGREAIATIENGRVPDGPRWR
jgi:hypothetical protein